MRTNQKCEHISAQKFQNPLFLRSFFRNFVASTKVINMKKSLFPLFVALLLAGCGSKNVPTVSEGRTAQTENLFQNLMLLSDSTVYMFGHQDDPCYGVGWVGDSARSDVRSTCGDLPAVIGFDLGHIELGDAFNLDGVPFDRMRREIIDHFDRGGVVTLSWHLNNPLSGGTAWVADSLRAVETNTVAAVLDGGSCHELFLTWLDRVAQFLNSLETSYGVQVPVVFRPWHEHSGSWFWWGHDHCTDQQYKDLWRLTADHLREQGVSNVLYAYSPGTEADGDETRYMERYPGDDIIDLLGLDCYCYAPDADTTLMNTYAATLDKNLSMVCRLAKKHQKAAALTETGYEGLPYSNWWTAILNPVLQRHPVCYVLVWRNAHDKAGHFFAPYPGQTSSSDFVSFYNLPQTLFLHDVNALYLEH